LIYRVALASVKVFALADLRVGQSIVLGDRMASGKWVKDLEAETPLAEAAHRVLRTRLDTVKKYLDLVAKKDEDPENVHQLRVSSRRTAAALDMFEDCLPSKVHSKAKKKLKKLRRAAGAARDWDVFLQSLKSRAIPAKARNGGLNLVIGYALSQRKAAETQLAAAAQDFSKKFGKFAKNVVASVQRQTSQNKSQTLTDLARESLLPLVRALTKAAQRDLTNADNLHQVRIAGKRLRYAMEILAPAFASPFREQLYPAIQEMQDILGQANDSRFAMARIKELREQLKKNANPGKRNRAALAELIAYHQARWDRERQRFNRWWQAWQKSGGEKAFRQLLQAGK
jgi:CHAD domain-containing protein